MPSYDYKCTECGKVKEIFTSMNHAPSSLQSCDCGGLLRKMFSPPGIIFKGSGFYRNDSRKTNK